MLADRNKPVTLVERYRCANEEGQRFAFADVTRELTEGHPLIATFCRERPCAIPGVAAQRQRSCFSVAVIGTVTVGEARYVIARDGLTDVEDDDASLFRSDPAELDLADGPWSEPGTGLYRWDEANTNVVVVVLNHESAAGP